ncbi:GGDEF domain-containing protein [Thalassospira marina]|uniref:diguanylate cyclase n=1 Tax=Thalassospira marina TaxID=2048283 RepID=A0A2N3KJ55_9PROT|nr:GGDEF domain-containing protein [Thalassospira marina]PKR50503.1 GGDEF domain-containing protein [Thalassospira marina]
MNEHADAVKQARKIARETVALLSSLDIAPTPSNYALFYHYLSGTNAELTQTIDILRSNHQEFDLLRCHYLCERFFGSQAFNPAPSSHSAGIHAGSSVHSRLIDARPPHMTDSPLPNPFGDIANSSEDSGQNSTSSTGTNGNIDDDTVSSEISRLRQDLEEMRKEAMTDPLTGIANRKMFDQQLRNRAMEAMETGTPLCLLMIDVDHFKQFNDTYGHQTGDQVIRLLAQTLRNNIKGRDTAARYGGEEFSVILPRTDVANARRLAEIIRQNVGQKHVISEIDGSPIEKITVSIGIGCFDYGEPLGRLIQRADQALYLAKQKGRDCVVTEDELNQANDSAPLKPETPVQPMQMTIPRANDAAEPQLNRDGEHKKPKSIPA